MPEAAGRSGTGHKINALAPKLLGEMLDISTAMMGDQFSTPKELCDDVKARAGLDLNLEFHTSDGRRIVPALGRNRC